MTTTPISRSSVAAVQLRRPLLRRLLDPCRRLVAFRRQPPLGRILVPGLHVEPPQRTFHGGAHAAGSPTHRSPSAPVRRVTSSVPNNYEHLALVSGGLDYYGDAGMAPSQPGKRRPRMGEGSGLRTSPSTSGSGTDSTSTSNSTTNGPPTCSCRCPNPMPTRDTDTTGTTSA